MKNKNLTGGLFVGTFTNVVFWALYTQTGNIISSIAITAVVSTGFIATFLIATLKMTQSCQVVLA